MQKSPNHQKKLQKNDSKPSKLSTQKSAFLSTKASNQGFETLLHT